MLLPFCLILTSLQKVSCDTTNDIIVKQNIWRHVIFVKFQKIPLKKAMAKTSWEIVVLSSIIPLNSNIYIYIYIYYIYILYFVYKDNCFPFNILM